MAKHPRGSYMGIASTALEVAAPENKYIISTLSSTRKYVRLTSGA